MSTNIEWVRNPDGSKGETWNPITGCTKVGPGCKNCYAERMARRLAGRYGYPEAPHHFDVTLHPDRLEQPAGWRKPCMIFVNSMSDLFHEDVPFTFIVQVFDVMRETPQHTYQLLTKRPRRMRSFIEAYQGWYDSPIPDNVWLGVSVENSDYLWRIEELMRCPAAVRFVSCEPLLGSMDLTEYLRYRFVGQHNVGLPDNWPPLDWVIVGGESGPRARPLHPQRARDIRDQCQAAGVPFFFKQWGAWLGVDYTGQMIAPDCPQWKRADGASGDVGKRPEVDFGDGHGAVRVGKKAAGRLLDSVLHEEYPQVA